jgi:tetratricopeptide (TPR) repeat protein
VKIASPKINSAHLSANDAALLRCKTALEQKDRGDYEGAQKTMRPFWSRVGERPKTTGLDSSVAAEVWLCVGILTSWIGSRDQLRDAQELAKDLITQAMTYFASSGDAAKVAVAQSEIAYCYYREGTLSEARSWLHDALNKLTFEGAARARALLKLTTVECSAARFNEALELLNKNQRLFRKITNHTIKGGYHHELAIIHRSLATRENKLEYLRRAISEYKEAETQFRLAHNQIYRAGVLNNIGFLLYKLSRYKDAHKYLNEARRLTVRFKDKAYTAQIEDSLAQVLTAEGKLTEAVSVARRAVSAFQKAGHFCMMAEALGIAVARLGQTERAQFLFRQAIKTAHQVNALNVAGLAALALLEEVRELSPTVLQAAYRQAREWLANSQSPDIKVRLGDVAERLTASIHIELNEEQATAILLTEPGGLKEQLWKHEGIVIKRALAQANGSVTKAASLLGVRYQSLAFIIETRHRDLLKERSPIRRRRRKVNRARR